MIKFDSIEDAIEDMRNGKMIIVVDDEDRENEGDFVMAGAKATAESINFMAKHGKGIICTPITAQRAEALNLGLMVSQNSSSHETAFTVSIDIKTCTTGVSAQERCDTVLSLCNENTCPSDLVRPGHIFPLIAKDGGVLTRPGHTEAAVDLSIMAGFDGTGVICEIMRDDGTMARADELYQMAQDWGMRFVKIEDLIEYRKMKENLLNLETTVKLPTDHGEFVLHSFSSIYPNENEILALSKGSFSKGERVLVRVHSECMTGDVFGSQRCDCGEQLKNSMQLIEDKGQGLVIYLRQEGRGIGLANKLKAYSLQEQGFDTVAANQKLGFGADLREYHMAIQILKHFGIDKVSLLTNNPDKIKGLSKNNFIDVERHSIESTINENNKTYLKTKRDMMGHLISSKGKEI